MNADRTPGHSSPEFKNRDFFWIDCRVCFIKHGQFSSIYSYRWPRRRMGNFIPKTMSPKATMRQKVLAIFVLVTYCFVYIL